MINSFFEDNKAILIGLGKQEYEKGLGLYSLWFALDDLYVFGKIKKNFQKDYPLKIEVFLNIILYLLDNNYMKLANNGAIIQLPHQIQIENFKKSFPKSSQIVDADMGTWFFTDECYAGAVWIYKLENGSDYYLWT